jgi:hypothetical protein
MVTRAAREGHGPWPTAHARGMLYTWASGGHALRLWPE